MPSMQTMERVWMGVLSFMLLFMVSFVSIISWECENPPTKLDKFITSIQEHCGFND